MYKRMIKRRVLSVLGALVFLFMVSACGIAEEESYSQISAEEAKKIMDSKEDYVLLDVRTAEEFEEKHIPGAVLIPHDEIAEKAEEALPDKDKIILVYCRSGNRSKIASEELVKLGYTGVYEFGGIKDWPFDTE